ncbi:lyase family protein [Micromonospora sp. WMMD1082]|uniref:argininosuccinate lyase n=1 Tax=Micromonospora sp. WMMD1082 TaxID=3016104 RepID=UPI002415FDF7|nr:lyase family protein [Micromonospora sp. WMMD1082]MDG4797032.1 lyase family protein [Micromonospora sp. WMMD1082]
MTGRPVADPTPPLTGRLGRAPSAVLHEHVLAPQFRFEADHLLGWYRLVERVLLAEYTRMGLVTDAEAASIAGLLDEATAERITADPAANLSDICLALERHVLTGLPAVPPAWHVDRSRNDIQATAHLLYARSELLDLAEALLELARVARHRAGAVAHLPMPGYTHLQAAQVITPGFFLSALVEHCLRTLRRLVMTYDEINLSPLGAGAMSGQELPWDRDRMALLLGCAGPQPHALTAVASRAWALEIAGEFSHFGVGLSRFVTDLMAWASSAYGFVELPDELAGISAAMPQKKNYPVLERIRGRTAHLTSLALDLATGQRSTPYSNMVEVSKEAGAHLHDLFRSARGVLALLRAVLEHLRWHPETMRAACDREFLGGFTLANRLTLDEGVPWRTAQVVVGRYVSAKLAAGDPLDRPDPRLLARLAEAAGHPLTEPAARLRGLDSDGQLAVKCSAGSARPDHVRDLLDRQETALDALAREWHRRRGTVESAVREAYALVAAGPPTATVAP